jgi:drug/metabolite transporter (DMT)-like permease
VFAAFLTTLLFSISAVTAQRATRTLGSAETNFARIICGTAFLALVAHVFGQGLSGSALPMFLDSGCVGFGIGDLAFYHALPRIGSRLSILLVLCVSSPLAVLIEWLWLGTTLSPAEIAASATILAGVALALTRGRSSADQETEQPRHFGTGILFGLIASTCQGCGAVLSRKAFSIATAAGENIDGITAAYQLILGGVGIALIGLLILKRQSFAKVLQDRKRGLPLFSDEHKARWRKTWPWVVVNALAGSALGVSFFQWALKTTPTGVVLPIVAMTPIVIIPFSRYIEGERPTRRSLFGGFIAVCGAVALAMLKK